MQNLVRKWRKLALCFFRATATVLLFFNLAPPRRAPSFLVRASGAVALKVAQVPSTVNKENLEHRKYYRRNNGDRHIWYVVGTCRSLREY